MTHFEKMSTWMTKWTGSQQAFFLASTSIIVWLISGPIFNFSDTWQLVINTATTIVTFLMVFLIQQSQNKENMAIEAKLDELIASSKASNKLIGLEELSEKEIEEIKDRYFKLRDQA
jgi:low affinity Fe/Cu permease